MQTQGHRFGGPRAEPLTPETVADVLRIIAGLNQDLHSPELSGYASPEITNAMLDLIALVERDCQVTHILFADPATPITDEAQRLGRSVDSYWSGIHGE